MKRSDRILSQLEGATVVSTTEAQVGPVVNVSDRIAKGLFIVNSGSQDATIRVYASASGVESADTGLDGATYTAAEVALDWSLLHTFALVKGTTEVFTTSEVVNYIKITGATATGSTTLSWSIMGCTVR